ncbi:MAG TPA: glycosyltransferase family 4 protein [Allosphingosinicella sp.]|nr:glycosyltransferase family 4 protein [Allosphingosinicella sp.]
MRLLFAIKTLALPGGGTERVLADLTSALARRGHEMTVLSFDRPGQEPFYTLDPAVQRLSLGIGDVGRGTRPGEAIGRVRALRRLVTEVRPDVAVGFMHSAYLPLGLGLMRTPIPVVASEHIAYDHYRTRPLQAALLRMTPAVAKVITVISPAIRDGFPASLRRRMAVVPNPVSAHDRRRADVGGEGPAPKTLLAVGRLEEQKDHMTLIGAFARLAERFPDWRLRIVGEGSLRQSLEAQVARLGLGERVSLPGATARIDDEYVAAQLFAMPSSYESFGLTTAEALSHGLPVVGFADCPGTNELVRHGFNGALVSGADREAALAQGLAPLMASAELRQRLAAAGPDSIEGFAPERIVDVWEALLSRIASAPE